MAAMAKVLSLYPIFRTGSGHMGQGPGISQSYQIGEKTGTESVALITNGYPFVTNRNRFGSGLLANLIALAYTRALPHVDRNPSLKIG